MITSCALSLAAPIACAASQSEPVTAATAPTAIVFISSAGPLNFLWGVRPDGRRLQPLAPACTAFPAPGGAHILIRSSDTGSSGGCFGGWHLLKSDGTQRRRVAGIEVLGAAWSPRGDRLLLNESGSLYVVNADGSGRRLLFNRARDDPTWAPDGRHAVTAYASARSAIYKSTNDPARWTPLLESEDALLGQPDWSPDGTRLAFTREPRTGDDRDTDVHVGRNGSGAVELARSSANDVEPSFSRDGTRIAFASDRAGNFDVYVVDADGSNLVQVTTHAANERAPTWSPDGTRIAFQTRRFGSAEIAIVDLATRTVTRLTTETQAAGNPDWSPDGTAIAYGLEGRIGVIRPDGRARRLLPFENAATPRWSFDSRRLTFVTSDDVRTAAADGTDERVVARATATAPTWSPDGTVTFAVQRETVRLDLVDVDTGLHVSLTDGIGGGDERPAWSPDGTSLAFFRGGELVLRDMETGRERSVSGVVPWGAAGWSPRGGTFAFASGAVLFAVGDGEPLRLTPPSVALVGDWSWSPDGEAIAFAGRPRGRSYSEIYVVDVASRALRRLTTTRVGEASTGPRWSPNGRQIAYSRCRFAARLFQCEADVVVVSAAGGRSSLVTSPFPFGGSNDDAHWVRTVLRSGRTPGAGHVSLVQPRRVIVAPAVTGVFAGPGAVAALTRPARDPSACTRIVVAVAARARAQTIACDDETVNAAAFGAGKFAWVGGAGSCLFVAELDRLRWTRTPCKEEQPLRFPMMGRPNWDVTGIAGDDNVLAFSEDSRSGTSTQVWRLSGRSRARIYTSPAGTVADADGDRIALIVPGPAVRVIGTDGSPIAALRPLRRTRFSTLADVALDGQTAVIEIGNVLEVHDIRRRKRIRIHRLPGRWDGAATFIGARDGIAAYSTPAAVHVLDLRTGRATTLRILGSAPPYAARFGDDGLFVSYNLMRVPAGGRVGLVPSRDLAAALRR